MWNDYSVVVEEIQMDYAVVLYMNEEKTAMVKEWIKELAPVCGSDYCLCTEPHITISAIIADDEELVKKEAAELSKVLKKGEIMEKEGLYKAFEKLSEIFTPFCAEIDKMALIKWEEDNPYQELSVYDLK